MGNVDTLLQDFGNQFVNGLANIMNANESRFKKIVYKYDLISGKVNMVMYMRGWRDGFYHRYSYDAENRLVLAETSTDSLVWEKDARYEYYRHGPLARVTLGDQQSLSRLSGMQGIDYAYTLHSLPRLSGGWLKGINSTGGGIKYDMGSDGDTSGMHRYTASDAIGLTLNYFTGDYAAIDGSTPFPGYSGAMPAGAYRPLYNGNISSQSVYQKKFEGSSPGGPLIFYNYKYDQLNRLVQQDAYNGFNVDSNRWETASNMGSLGERLKERIAYDANGNIFRYLRKSLNSGTADMDSLTYNYYAGNNRLRYITDSVLPGTYTGYVPDIENQTDTLNYVYDSIGNLVKDNAEGITNIKWNVYGKIIEITRTPTTALPARKIWYTYDALGNRISQVDTTSNRRKRFTWYVRDAQGNLLSTYTAEGDMQFGIGGQNLYQAERYIYGSSRIGSYNLGLRVDVANNTPNPSGSPLYRGWKQYELTNHLGNVLAVVSDKKIGVSSGGSSLIGYYEPEIVSATDYYPFGMASRVALGSGKQYRFGFNGKENDNDVKGYGGQQDYGMRIYDPRVGRFLSVDPLTRGFPMLTPYQFSSNSPIANIDLDGKEAEYYKLELDQKTGGARLTLTRADDNVGLFGSKLVPKRVVDYKGETYTFHYKPGSPNESEFYEFVANPEEHLANDPYLESDGERNRQYWAEAGLVIMSGGVSMYKSMGSKGASVAKGTSQISTKKQVESAHGNDPTNAATVSTSGDVRPKSSSPSNTTVNSKKANNNGIIYEVPGTDTKSGKPYIGRHKKPTPGTRKSDGGRDRKKAKVIDTYDPNNVEEGQYKEQKAIDAKGGLPKLDNERNEVTPDRMKQLEKKYGTKG